MAVNDTSGHEEVGRPPAASRSGPDARARPTPRCARPGHGSLWLALELERFRSRRMLVRTARGCRAWGEGDGSGHFVVSRDELAPHPPVPCAEAQHVAPDGSRDAPVPVVSVPASQLDLSRRVRAVLLQGHSEVASSTRAGPLAGPPAR